MKPLFPNPGILPTRPEPRPGDVLNLEVEGLPPYKDTRFSIRNPRHRHYDRFARLRDAATATMAGRKWSDGPIGLELVVFAPAMVHTLVEYLGGVMDTLDGSHGCDFTYLPIAYQDDCQVSATRLRFTPHEQTKYTLRIAFLEDKPCVGTSVDDIVIPQF